ncbi:MAG: hypothetical protein WCB93_03300, partial [Gallionella sp.]
RVVLPSRCGWFFRQVNGKCISLKHELYIELKRYHSIDSVAIEYHGYAIGIWSGVHNGANTDHG